MHGNLFGKRFICDARCLFIINDDITSVRASGETGRHFPLSTLISPNHHTCRAPKNDVRENFNALDQATDPAERKMQCLFLRQKNSRYTGKTCDFNSSNMVTHSRKILSLCSRSQIKLRRKRFLQVLTWHAEAQACGKRQDWREKKFEKLGKFATQSRYHREKSYRKIVEIFGVEGGRM